MHPWEPFWFKPPHWSSKMLTDTLPHATATLDWPPPVTSMLSNMMGWNSLKSGTKIIPSFSHLFQLFCHSNSNKKELTSFKLHATMCNVRKACTILPYPFWEKNYFCLVYSHYICSPPVINLVYVLVARSIVGVSFWLCFFKLCLIMYPPT